MANRHRRYHCCHRMAILSSPFCRKHLLLKGFVALGRRIEQKNQFRMLVVHSGKIGCSLAGEEVLLVALVKVRIQAQILSRLLLLCFVLQILPQIQSKYLQLCSEPQAMVQIL